MSSSIEDILAVAENPAYVRAATARVLLRQDLLARHEQLDADLLLALEDDARLNRTPVAPRLVEEIEALQAEIETAKVAFRFESIGKKAWADLLGLHPPTKEQRRVDARVDHNEQTFPVAAIAASCVDPVLTLADAQRLERALNASQFNLLWAKCIDANIGGLSDPKSLAASFITRRANLPSGDSATTTDEQSLAASSSDAS